MPAATCKTCGRMTNSAVSNYATAKKFGEVTECYLAVDPVTKNWTKGCAWQNIIGTVEQQMYEGYLGKSAIPNQSSNDDLLKGESDE